MAFASGDGTGDSVLPAEGRPVADGGSPAAGTAPAARGRGSRDRLMVFSGLLMLLLLLGVSVFKVPYVVESPGPAINTLGEDGGQRLINVTGHQTYPTTGRLDLLTVAVSGGPGSNVGIPDVLLGWFDKTRSVVPREALYPAGVTSQQIQQQNTSDMTDSQQEAVAASLKNLGIGYSTRLTVTGLTPQSPAEGKLRRDDVLLKIDSQPVTSVDGLKAAVAAAPAGKNVAMEIERGGAAQTVEVTPASVSGVPQLGVFLAQSFDFPFDVSIKLNNIGGPSAGMMFSLGIIDTLTPGAMTGGEHIAGTGTIDPEGEVGPIGGIRQKMFGARSAGADWFLAPEDDCDEVVDHVPQGLRVVKVGTLTEARTAVEAIAGAKNADSPTAEKIKNLPTCTASSSTAP